MPPGEPDVSASPDLADGNVVEYACGGSFIIDLDAVSAPHIASHAGYDLINYELASSSCGGICLDWVIIEVCAEPCVTWVTVFNWGDGVVDGNTNVASFGSDGEDDNEPIPGGALHASVSGRMSGIEIDVEFGGTLPAPPGGYRYIRIQSPLNPNNDGSDVDAIEILP
jgi:hypothetical protein